MHKREPNISFVMPFLNIEFQREDYCGYEGECKRDRSLQQFVCYICKHLKRLDIAEILDKEHNRLIEERTKNV